MMIVVQIIEIHEILELHLIINHIHLIINLEVIWDYKKELKDQDKALEIEEIDKTNKMSNNRDLIEIQVVFGTQERKEDSELKSRNAIKIQNTVTDTKKKEMNFPKDKTRDKKNILINKI